MGLPVGADAVSPPTRPAYPGARAGSPARPWPGIFDLGGGPPGAMPATPGVQYHEGPRRQLGRPEALSQSNHRAGIWKTRNGVAT
jgi:hypothetical protein